MLCTTIRYFEIATLSLLVIWNTFFEWKIAELDFFSGIELSNVSRK